MADARFQRTQMLLGGAAMAALSEAHVMVLGIGGVGGYVVEALARCGVGQLTLIDHDTVSLTNLNRQILATEAVLGRLKVEVARERCLAIHPQMTVHALPLFLTPETAEDLDFAAFDYIVDAADTVTTKLDLIQRAQRAGVPVISAMGAGNKLDPTAFRVTDIFQTQGDPLARVMRRELRKRGIDHLKVVISDELPLPLQEPPADADPEARKQPPGSAIFAPAAAGLALAHAVVMDLIAAKV